MNTHAAPNLLLPSVSLQHLGLVTTLALSALGAVPGIRLVLAAGGALAIATGAVALLEYAFGVPNASAIYLVAVVFVASHAFDCIGAKSEGMHSAFIDRRGLPFGDSAHQPDFIAPDMKSLADVML